MSAPPGPPRQPLPPRLVDYSLNYGRDVIREFLESVAPFHCVVDLGAGAGDDLRTAHAICPDAQLQGLDTAPSPFPFGSMTRLDIEHERFPFADGSVDVVIANQVLEHTKEIFWVVHESTRILARGGHLVIGVPNLASLHNRILLSLGRQPTAIRSASAHIRGFTAADLRDLVAACFPGGYSITARRGANFYPLPPRLARPAARVLPGMAWGLFLLLRKERDYADEFARFPYLAQLETPFWAGSPGNNA